MCVSGGCLHVFAHANAAVAGVNPLVPSSACGGPITKAIRAQLKKLIAGTRPAPTSRRSSRKPTLKDIARALVAHVRKSVTIDWTLREKRPSPNPRPRPPHSPQIRLPARQAGKGCPNGFGSSQIAVCRLGSFDVRWLQRGSNQLRLVAQMDGETGEMSVVLVR